MNCDKLQIACVCGEWHYLKELKAVERERDISYYCPNLRPLTLAVNQLFELKEAALTR